MDKYEVFSCADMEQQDKACPNLQTVNTGLCRKKRKVFLSSATVPAYPAAVSDAMFYAGCPTILKHIRKCTFRKYYI